MELEQQQTEVTPVTPPKRTGASVGGLSLVALVAVVIFAVIIWSGIASRAQAGSTLNTETSE